MPEKKECPLFVVGGVHITDVKLCKVHEMLFQLREDIEAKFQEVNEQLRVLEEKIVLCSKI
jgi:hypothetical protein